MRHTHTEVRRTSHLLHDIAHMPDHGTITVGEFVSLLGDRSFALAILIFSLPNSLPVPGIPGFSTLTGLPILLIALQVVYGRRSIWLPRSVADKRFSQAFLARIVHKALPVVLWLEKFIRPRLAAVCQSLGERLIGLLIAVMALILSLPVVGGNFLPGFSISLLALALLENDGVFAVISALFTLVSIYLMYKILALVALGVFDWIMHLF